MRSRRAMTAAIAAAAVIAIGGCGDDQEIATDTTASSESQSKEEFIAAADAICTETAAEIDAEVKRRLTGLPASPSSKELIALFTKVTLPALERQAEQIEALPAPEGAGEEADAILAAAREAIAESRADPEALLVPQGGSTPFDEVNRLSQQFGFESCGAAEEAG